jgi:hypothetical protein
VRWIIEVREITGDNGRIIIPEWGLDLALHPGEQTVDFTPLQIGIVTWHSRSGATLARFLVEDPRTSMTHMH